jgi:hypothetical protein
MEAAMRRAFAVIALLLSSTQAVDAQDRKSILFIGNSFTFGTGSSVRFYRPNTVTDLNREGIGGVPALFKSFADQSGLSYDVYLETRGGSGFEFHLENKLTELSTRKWDQVVMQGQSTLDLEKDGDPTKFLATGPQLVKFLRERSSGVEIYVTATWSRADKTYPEGAPWFGKPIETMARDVRAAYDELAKRTPGVKSVNPVGDAWTRAMQAGVADTNPYDGIDAGKLNLWTYDSYHASTFGYYLEALVIFGNVTGRDPRSLGEKECSAFELGLSRAQVKALQQVAFDQLSAEGRVRPGPAEPSAPARCPSST